MKNKIFETDKVEIRWLSGSYGTTTQQGWPGTTCQSRDWKPCLEESLVAAQDGG